MIQPLLHSHPHTLMHTHSQSHTLKHNHNLILPFIYTHKHPFHTCAHSHTYSHVHTHVHPVFFCSFSSSLCSEGESAFCLAACNRSVGLTEGMCPSLATSSFRQPHLRSFCSHISRSQFAFSPYLLEARRKFCEHIHVHTGTRLFFFASSSFQVVTWTWNIGE